jgi:hemerythrin
LTDDESEIFIAEVEMLIEWNAKRKIGHARIDAEHQELFRLANKFLTACTKQSMNETADVFNAYTRQHFSHEEAMMRQLRYPAAATHLHEHVGLLDTLDKIMDAIDEEILSKAELEDFVGYWLVKHIAIFDAPLAVYVRRNCETLPS